MKITIENIVLSRGNTHCEAPEDLKIQGSKELQVVSLLRAKGIKIFDRGNKKIVVTFKITRQHTNADEALIHTIQHTEAATSVHGNTTFEIEDAKKSIFYLTDASVRYVVSHVEGVTSYLAYEIIGSNIEN